MFNQRSQLETILFEGDNLQKKKIKTEFVEGTKNKWWNCRGGLLDSAEVAHLFAPFTSPAPWEVIFLPVLQGRDHLRSTWRHRLRSFPTSSYVTVDYSHGEEQMNRRLSRGATLVSSSLRYFIPSRERLPRRTDATD